MRFSRQKYWSGLPCPSPGDLPHPGTEPKSPVSPALAGRFFTTQPPGKPKVCTGLANFGRPIPSQNQMDFLAMNCLHPGLCQVCLNVSVSLFLFLFCRWVPLCHILDSHIYVRLYLIFFFQYNSQQKCEIFTILL